MEDTLNTGSWPQANTFMDIISPRARSASPRSTPDKSNTLMRKAVRHPKSVAVETVTDRSEEEYEQSVLKNSRPDLYQAASLTDQSPLISRFSPTASSFENTFEAPQEESYIEQAEPQIEQQVAVDEPMELAIKQPTFNIFDKSIPTTFEYSRPTPKTSRLSVFKRISGWSVLAIAVIGIVGGGIFINRNLSKFELYMASSRAGFEATLPSIKPSGYGLSGISTGSGMIEASFKSNVDNRAYSISEKKSSVSSSTLLSGYVENRAGLNYQTITTPSNVIYVYSGHDATWVNNGIWYVVQDNNSLSDHQIIDIADSM